MKVTPRAPLRLTALPLLATMAGCSLAPPTPPQTTSWPYTLHLNCRPFGAITSSVPRFGPIESGVRTYTMDTPGLGERALTWTGRTPQVELVFDTGHLRRVPVRSGLTSILLPDDVSGRLSTLGRYELPTATATDGMWGATFWEAGQRTEWIQTIAGQPPFRLDEDDRYESSHRVSGVIEQPEASPPATQTLHGRVVDPHGAPVEAARLLWWNVGGDLRNDVTSGIEGLFLIDDLPERTGQLWACVPGFDATWPVVGRRVEPGESTTLVLDPAACTGSLALTVQRPDDVGKADVTVRVWQRASGLGLMARPLDSADGSLHFALDRFPPGDYTIEVLCPGFGVVPGGTFASDGHAKIERTIALPASCLVTVVRSTVLADFALVRVTPTCDLRIELPNELPGPFRLGPGDYAARWRDATGDHELAFAIPTMPPATRTVTLR